MEENIKKEPMENETGVSLARAWTVVFICLIFVTIALFDRQAITLMVDPIKESFAISDAQMGFLQGPAFAIFFLIGSLPMGWIIDRFSSRWALYFGVTFWSLATIACALSNSFAMLLTARCLLGLGQAVLQPASWNIVAKLFPPHKLALAISVLSMGAQIGAASSYVLGGILLAEASYFSSLQFPLVEGLAPWKIVFLIAGVPSLGLAFLAFIIPNKQRGKRRNADIKDSTPVDLVTFLRSNWKFLLCHFIGFACLCALVYGAANWAPTFLLRNFSLDIKTVGIILALTAVPIGTAGFMFNGWYVDRSFSKGRDDAHLTHFAYVCIGLILVGGLGFLYSTEVWLIIICIALINFMQPFAGVAAAILQITTPPELRGRVSGIFIMFYSAFGMTVGPSFVALLADKLSLTTALSLNFIIFGSAASLCFWLGRKHSRKSVEKMRLALESQA